MKVLTRYWDIFKRWQRRFHFFVETASVQELPGQLNPALMYLVGEGTYLWFVAFLCPCGCGDIVQLSLIPEDTPKWHLTEHWNGSITLHPSIWRNKGCRSHFFVKKGMVWWVRQDYK